MKIKNQVSLLVALLFLGGCGGSSESGNNDEEVQKVKQINESDVAEKYITPVDEYWIGGPQFDYADLGEEVIFSHFIATSLVKVNDSGYFEHVRSHEDMSSTFVAKLNDNLVALHAGTDIKFYNYDNDVFDLAYNANVKIGSNPHLQTIGNCVYWISREDYGTAVSKACENAGSFSQDVVFVTSGYVFKLQATAEGQLLILEGIEGENYLRLFSTDGALLDEYAYELPIYGHSVEQIGNSFFVTGTTTLYTFSVRNSSLSDIQVLQVFEPQTGMNGSNALTTHGNNLIYTVDDYIYYYQMSSNGQVNQVYKAQVSYVVSSMFVKNDTLIVNYVGSFDSTPSIGMETFQLAELLN
ncbi:MAG: hypothetical protein WEA82_05445 [Idiomarina sp.]